MEIDQRSYTKVNSIENKLRQFLRMAGKRGLTLQEAAQVAGSERAAQNAISRVKRLRLEPHEEIRGFRAKRGMPMRYVLRNRRGFAEEAKNSPVKVSLPEVKGLLEPFKEENVEPAWKLREERGALAREKSAFKPYGEGLTKREQTYNLLKERGQEGASTEDIDKAVKGEARNAITGVRQYLKRQGNIEKVITRNVGWSKFRYYLVAGKAEKKRPTTPYSKLVRPTPTSSSFDKLTEGLESALEAAKEIRETLKRL